MYAQLSDTHLSRRVKLGHGTAVSERAGSVNVYLVASVNVQLVIPTDQVCPCLALARLPLPLALSLHIDAPPSRIVFSTTNYLGRGKGPMTPSCIMA